MKRGTSHFLQHSWRDNIHTAGFPRGKYITYYMMVRQKGRFPDILSGTLDDNTASDISDTN